MLAYAPRPERRRLQPSALALIVGAHVVAILAVMSAKMEAVPDREKPIVVTTIPIPPEPQPQDPPPQTPNPAPTPFTAPDAFVPLPPLPGPTADPLPPQPLPGPAAGTGAGMNPLPTPIVRKGPRFTTPPDDVRPPYPDLMRAQERETVLRLRLAIDERGRVVAVDPLGKAEPAFLAAARRHILKAWRYVPAMEGDHAIPSTTVITLEFKLDS